MFCYLQYHEFINLIWFQIINCIESMFLRWIFHHRGVTNWMQQPYLFEFIAIDYFNAVIYGCNAILIIMWLRTIDYIESMFLWWIFHCRGITNLIQQPCLFESIASVFTKHVLWISMSIRLRLFECIKSIFHHRGVTNWMQQPYRLLSHF